MNKRLSLYTAMIGFFILIISLGLLTAFGNAITHPKYLICISIVLVLTAPLLYKRRKKKLEKQSTDTTEMLYI